MTDEHVKYNPDEKPVIDDLVTGMPGVKEGKAFGYPAYKVNGKVFMFVMGHGVTIKLPESRVSALVNSRPEFRPFGPTTEIIWKAWLKIEAPDPQAYLEFEPLLQESMQFVAEGGKG